MHANHPGAGKNVGCCTNMSCYVPGGRCLCDNYCTYFNIVALMFHHSGHLGNSHCKYGSLSHRNSDHLKLGSFHPEDNMHWSNQCWHMFQALHDNIIIIDML